MTHAGHDHCQSLLFAIGNGILIADASAGLYISQYPCRVAHFDTVVKREECITGHYRSCGFGAKLFCFFQRLPERINP